MPRGKSMRKTLRTSRGCWQKYGYHKDPSYQKHPKVLNTINFSKSMHYNPFSYLRSEKDILKLVNTIIVNTKGEGAQSGEDFWVKAERLYYTALIGYIYYEAPEEEKNIITLLDMINASDTREDDEDYKNPVDLMFDRLEEKDPEHFALKQYKKYKLAAGKTAKSILISCGARLAPFDIKELRDLMEYDEMELDTLGDRKTALFLIMSDTDSTFNFVIAILQSQLFNLLCDKADDVYGGRLPVHVRCILDEFANIGQIPQFDKLIATIRSREISASIILQSQSQLVPCGNACISVDGDAIPHLVLDNQHGGLFEVFAQLLNVVAHKTVVDVHRRSVVKEIQRAGHIQIKCLCHAVSFRQVLRHKRIVQVGQDRHILRARVCKVVLIDTLHGAVNDCPFNGFQPGFAAHDKLTQRQHKVGFECQRVFVLRIVQIDVERIYIVRAGR